MSLLGCVDTSNVEDLLMLGRVYPPANDPEPILETAGRLDLMLGLTSGSGEGGGDGSSAGTYRWE